MPSGHVSKNGKVTRNRASEDRYSGVTYISGSDHDESNRSSADTNRKANKIIASGTRKKTRHSRDNVIAGGGKPLVEYSDVSSETLSSGPELGEITEDEHINLSDGEVGSSDLYRMSQGKDILHRTHHKVKHHKSRHRHHDESPLAIDRSLSPLPLHKHKKSKRRDGSPNQDYSLDDEDVVLHSQKSHSKLRKRKHRKEKKSRHSSPLSVKRKKKKRHRSRSSSAADISRTPPLTDRLKGSLPNTWNSSPQKNTSPISPSYESPKKSSLPEIRRSSPALQGSPHTPLIPAKAYEPLRDRLGGPSSPGSAGISPIDEGQRLSITICDPSAKSSCRSSLNESIPTPLKFSPEANVCNYSICNSIIGDHYKTYLGGNFSQNKSPSRIGETKLQFTKSGIYDNNCETSKNINLRENLGESCNCSIKNKKCEIEKKEKNKCKLPVTLNEELDSKSSISQNVNKILESEYTLGGKTDSFDEKHCKGTTEENWKKFYLKSNLNMKIYKKNKKKVTDEILFGIANIKDYKTKIELLKNKLKDYDKLKYSKNKSVVESLNFRKGEESIRTPDLELRKRERVPSKRDGNTSMLRKADEVVKNIELINKGMCMGKRVGQVMYKVEGNLKRRGDNEWNKKLVPDWRKMEGREFFLRKKKEYRKKERNFKNRSPFRSSSDERFSPFYYIVSSDYENSENFYFHDGLYYR